MLSDMIEDDNYAKVKGKTIIIYRTICFKSFCHLTPKLLLFCQRKTRIIYNDIIFGRKKSTTANYRNSLTIWEVMWNG